MVQTATMRLVVKSILGGVLLVLSFVLIVLGILLLVLLPSYIHNEIIDVRFLNITILFTLSFRRRYFTDSSTKVRRESRFGRYREKVG